MCEKNYLFECHLGDELRIVELTGKASVTMVNPKQLWQSLVDGMGPKRTWRNLSVSQAWIKYTV